MASKDTNRTKHVTAAAGFIVKVTLRRGNHTDCQRLCILLLVCAQYACVQYACVLCEAAASCSPGMLCPCSALSVGPSAL